MSLKSTALGGIFGSLSPIPSQFYAFEIAAKVEGGKVSSLPGGEVVIDGRGVDNLGAIGDLVISFL